MGEPKHITRYCGKIAPNITCMVWEDNTPYLAYGLQQGRSKEMMSWNVAKAAVKAVRQGHVGGQPIGDVRMMPGSFLVDTQGILRAVHYNDDIADHADLQAML
jgi:hypothetical protein